MSDLTARMVAESLLLAAGGLFQPPSAEAAYRRIDEADRPRPRDPRFAAAALERAAAKRARKVARAAATGRALAPEESGA